MMEHCAMCGDPIESPDYMIAIEKHVSKGQKGCSVELRFVTAETAGDAPALGSLDCAVAYFRRFAITHMDRRFMTMNRSAAS